jgi:hypothetical protein
VQGALTIAEQQYRRAVVRHSRERWLHGYLGAARSVRRISSSAFGFRWAPVLIGAFAVGGLLYALTVSAMCGAVAVLLGASVFACLMYWPNDSALECKRAELPERMAEFERRRSELSAELAQLRTEFRESTERQRNWSNCLTEAEVRASRQYRLQQLCERNWKAMRGGELEEFLKEVFTELGYVVERIGGAGDQGVDLILSKGGYRIAIQVKGYVDNVPNTAIQEAYTGMRFHGCQACAVVTNSRFTSGGKNIASAVGCVLIDEFSLPMIILEQVDLLQMFTGAEPHAQRNATT